MQATRTGHDATTMRGPLGRGCGRGRRDGSWTRAYGYPWVSYPMDMGMSLKIYLRVLSGWISEIYRVGYRYYILLVVDTRDINLTII